MKVRVVSFSASRVTLRTETNNVFSVPMEYFGRCPCAGAIYDVKMTFRFIKACAEEWPKVSCGRSF